MIREKEAGLVPQLIKDIAHSLDGIEGITLVAVTGFDASGKTSFTDALQNEIHALRRNVTKISIDDFYNPHALWKDKDDPAIAWYRNGYNYQSFIDDVLQPLAKARKAGTSTYVPLKVFDRIKDEPVQKQSVEIAKDCIVLVEGIFLLRPELRERFDKSIFIHAPIMTLIARGIKRDIGRLGTAEDVFNAYRDTYIGAHRHYMAESSPYETADIIIDNTHYETPKIIDAVARTAMDAQCRESLAALPSWRFQPPVC